MQQAIACTSSTSNNFRRPSLDPQHIISLFKFFSVFFEIKKYLLTYFWTFGSVNAYTFPRICAVIFFVLVGLWRRAFSNVGTISADEGTSMTWKKLVLRGACRSPTVCLLGSDRASNIIGLTSTKKDCQHVQSQERRKVYDCCYFFIIIIIIINLEMYLIW